MAVFERILLTGGAGFVGSYLAPLLARLSRRGRAAYAERLARSRGCGWTPVAGDLLDASDRRNRRVAAPRSRGASRDRRRRRAGRAEQLAREFFRQLQSGDALARPPRLWRCSPPAFVYGASLNDGMPPKTRRATARRLWAIENRPRSAGGCAGPRSRLVIARPVNHSGPRQSEKSFVLSSFAAQIARSTPGAGTELRVATFRSRDFLDVRDVVAAYRP